MMNHVNSLFTTQEEERRKRCRRWRIEMHITQCSLLSQSLQSEFQNSRYTHLPKCSGKNYEICLHDLHDVQEQLSRLGSSSLQVYHHSQSIFICVCGCVFVCVCFCVYVFVCVCVAGKFGCRKQMWFGAPLGELLFSLSLVKCSLDS